jgi:mRNA interferase MazF
MNDTLNTVIVVPLTSTVRNLPFYIPITYNKHQVALACDQIKTIDKKRVGDRLALLTVKDSVSLSNILYAMFQFSVKN